MKLLLTTAVLPLALPATVQAEAGRGDVAASHQQRQRDASAAPLPTLPRGLGVDGHSGPAARQKNRSDLGILSGGRRLFANRRRAADDTEKEDRQVAIDLDQIKDQAALDQCADNACEPELCGCVAEGGNAAVCAVQLNAVCKGDMVKGDQSGEVFTIDECVTSPQYYDNVYCPFAACLVAGGSYAACDCGFYQASCDTYGNDPEFKDNADTLKHCAAHACCQTKDDDAGKATCLASFTGVVLADDKVEASAEPVVEAPADPVVEDPVVAAPVVEEPVVEEPVVGDTVVGAPVAGEPATAFAVEKRATGVGEPIAEEPVMAGPRMQFTEDSGGRGTRGGRTPVLMTMAVGALAWGWH